VEVEAGLVVALEVVATEVAFVQVGPIAGLLELNLTIG
jgi:hypothetical protein